MPKFKIESVYVERTTPVGDSLSFSLDVTSVDSGEELYLTYNRELSSNEVRFLRSKIRVGSITELNSDYWM